MGERITYSLGPIVNAEKGKEEQTPENIFGESVPQELELWLMVEPQIKNKNNKSPSSTEGKEKIRNLRKLRNRERRRAEDKGKEIRGE